MDVGRESGHPLRVLEVRFPFRSIRVECQQTGLLLLASGILSSNVLAALSGLVGSSATPCHRHLHYFSTIYTNRITNYVDYRIINTNIVFYLLKSVFE